MNQEQKIKLGFPIGAIQNEVTELFKRAGYDIKFHQEIEKVEAGDSEIECIPLRPISIVTFVQKGILDAGIATRASILEAEVKPQEFTIIKDTKYIFGKTKVVIAVPEDSKIKSTKDLQGKRIITRLPNITKKFLRENKISAQIIFSDTLVNESKVGNIADAIVELSKTGNILRAYQLRILETILESYLVLVANKNSLKNKWKKNKIENLTKVLKGAFSQKFNELMLTEPDLKNIDEIDFKIIRILSQDGRKSFVEMAEEIDLSPVGIKQRVEKLIKKGILEIKGCLVAKNFYSVSAHIMVEGNAEAVSWLVKKLKNSPLVYQLAKITGKYNLIISIMAQSLQRIDAVLVRV